jgi:(2S)-methylsuccinyl-CoA dehydrogenase
LALIGKPSPVAAQLIEALADHRAEVRQMVRVDGLDAHQIAIDNLVWHYAQAEAAFAVRDWAESTGSLLASPLADIAEAEALSFGGPAAPNVYPVPAALRLTSVADRPDQLEDLGAADEHRLLRSSIRDFARREIAPFAREIHRHDLDVPESIIKSAGELGLFGLSIPTEFGGSQDAEDFVAMLIVTEELSRVSLAAGGSLITRPEIVVRALLRGGTLEQKQRWLPAIATGELLVAVAVTEPDYGSNVGGIQCRAIRLPGGDWEINGTKLWCTFAGRSELLMVLCRTGDGGHRGLSVFIVEKPPFAGHEFEFRPAEGGVVRGRAIRTIGYRGMHTFELSFDGFRLPPDALVGGEAWLNRGFYLQMEGFSMGRIQTAGRAVGLMQAAVDGAIEYAKARSAFGEPIFNSQLIRSKIGMMAFRLDASRQLSYRAARLLAGGRGQTEASMAKLYASRMAELVTREAMQVHGAMGYSEETDAARHFVDARVLTIFEGTEEVLSLRVIGKSLLEQTQ